MNSLISLETYQEHTKLVERYKEKLQSENLSNVHEAYNALVLHRIYFQIISDPKPFTHGSLLFQYINDSFKSIENFLEEMVNAGLNTKGWVILGYDLIYRKLRLDIQDDHKDSLLYLLPIIPMDCYEHAWFMDYGADKATYLKNFVNAINWIKAEELFMAYKKIPLNMEMLI